MSRFMTMCGCAQCDAGSCPIVFPELQGPPSARRRKLAFLIDRTPAAEHSGELRKTQLIHSTFHSVKMYFVNFVRETRGEES